MARDYEKKNAQLRAYFQTPAGKAAHKRSHDKAAEKRRDATVRDMLIVDCRPMVEAMNNWRQP